MTVFRKILAAFLIVCISLGGVFCIGTYAYGKYTGYLERPDEAFGIEPTITVVDNDTGEEKVTGAPKEYLEYDGTMYYRNPNIVNILFLGVDSNDEREAASKGYRSDSIMLCALDVSNKTVQLLSVPRDTKANVYHLDGEGNVEFESTNRINAAYSFGRDGDVHAAQNTMRCVSELLENDGTFNIPIDYYVTVDMDGLEEVIDALDGVEVTLDDYFPGIGSEGDVVTLKGEKALLYARDRKNTGGDLARAHRQQILLIAIASEIKDMGAIETVQKLYGPIMDNIKTNLDVKQIMGLAGILDNMDINNIDMNMLEGKTGKEDGRSYFFHDEELTDQLMLDLFYIKDTTQSETTVAQADVTEEIQEML